MDPKRETQPVASTPSSEPGKPQTSAPPTWAEKLRAEMMQTEEGRESLRRGKEWAESARRDKSGEWLPMGDEED